MTGEPVRPPDRPTVMSRMLGSRRMALVGAVLILGLTACGSAADTNSTGATSAPASPPVIHVDGSPGVESAGGRSAAPMAAGDAAASDSKIMPAQMTYVYEGDVVDLTSPAASWYFEPTASPTTEQIEALARALGVEGDVRELPADMGGGWAVGTDTPGQATLNVGADAMHSWWYNPPMTAVMSPKCELYPPGDPMGDFDDPAVAPDSGPATDTATDAA